MMSSMDKITMLLHSNHKTEPSTLMQGLTGQAAVMSRVGVTLLVTLKVCVAVWKIVNTKQKDKQEALKQQQKRSNATQTSQQSSQWPHF